MTVLLVFLPFHSSEKLLHTTLDFIRGALSLFITTTSLIGNPFRRRVGRHFKNVFIMLRSWRILFLRLLYLGTNVDGWLFVLCLLRLFLGLHLWLFLARNATHFNNKYIESILWVTLMPELLKPLVLVGINGPLSKATVTVFDAHPSVIVVLVVVLVLAVVIINHLGHGRNLRGLGYHATIGYVGPILFLFLRFVRFMFCLRFLRTVDAVGYFHEFY
jgi:hypothetical protein